MPKSVFIKAKHKAIQQYHQDLQAYSDSGVTHEGALETAFQRLLGDVAKHHGCALVPKQKLKIGKSTIFPDGTVRQTLYDTRQGFWEAKDRGDNLDKEITAKIASGYPLTNTIFENTELAVLFQSGKERRRYDLTDKNEVADLLNDFFSYIEPEIEGFHEAVQEFSTRVPDLAKGLVAKLEDAHKTNKKFQAAFDIFFALCQTTLNPNISRAAVDEMLVQHLLTERLIRKIFDNPDFMHHNVIAVEIEKVIDALVSLTFSRDQYLKSLDRFYRAIEDAAHTLDDFAEKQHFLNTVYERFFQGYSVKVADTHGIVYTPQEIVDFMCASVEHVLQKEFNLTLGSKGVNILDPCTGTGNFIVNLINRIPKKDLPRVYKEQLFANEVMLLPYYIAALNIEHAYWERTGTYEPFEGLCFADTLDMTKDEYVALFTQENTARIRRQKLTPLTVVIGNPPYNVGQLNENDNNKNRQYKDIENRIKLTYAKDSAATLKAQLYDPYVKFFRWATDRLEGRDGVVCFVTNNSFVDQIAFDGMRKHIGKDFTCVYHLHLEGNVRQNPTLAGTVYNVFGIQIGVGITVAVRCRAHVGHTLQFVRMDKLLRKEEKLRWIAGQRSVGQVSWKGLEPDERGTWLVSNTNLEFSTFTSLGNKEARAASANESELLAIFKQYSPGVNSGRDSFVYSFDAAELAERAGRVCDDYNAELDRYQRKGKGKSVDDFVDYTKIKWSETLKKRLQAGAIASFDDLRIREGLYRAFAKRNLYYDQILNDRPGMFRRVFPNRVAEAENLVLVVSDIAFRAPTFNVMVADRIPDMHLCASVDAHQCFPFYVYDEDGSNRQENITDWALERFRAHYDDDLIDKWDIFNYVYGVLHDPGYRTKFAEDLKRELPRIPLAPDFAAFSNAGGQLVGLHVHYEKLEPYPLTWIESEGVPLSYRIDDKMRLSKDKQAIRVNASLTLAGIPPETFKYRLGNRSALEWVIDQYQVKDDERSGIHSDPNRVDDEEYIVRLVGQVVRVSLETVQIVKELPEEFAG